MARKMKDSGIEWIGEIPEGWEVHRMKSCISQRDGGAWGDEATGETGDCICLRIADFDYEHFRFTDSNNLTIRHYASPIIKKLLLQKNDILIEKSGGGEKTPVGRTVLFDKEYPALFANFMDRLRCSDFILPQYLQYVFVTFYKNRYTQNYIKQTTGIQNLDLSSMLADEFVPVPNLNEQKLIVCYLESKCSKIDNLLSKTRSSIEEYKKLKQAVITQAVTKGVRGERKMKPTDFTRWSEIPFDWDLKRVKSCIASISSGLSAVTDDANSEESGKFVLRTSAVSSGFFVPTEVKPVLKSAVNRLICPVEPDTLIVSRMNTASMVGACAYVANNHPNTFLPDKLWKIKFLPSYHTKYMWYALNSVPAKSWFSELATGASSSMQNISINDFTSNYLPIPAFSEQKEIANYLDAKCAEIDKLIAKKEQLVKGLESYKKSLIYEVVTGKREV